MQLDKNAKIRLKAYSLQYDDLKRKEDIIEHDFRESRKVARYLSRSKDDFLWANATRKIIESAKLKQELGLPADFQNLYHWLIIESYYAMYHAATAAIAKRKIKAGTHIATITSLAKHYVTTDELELDPVKMLEHMYLTYIESGRESRKGAQYNVDREYSKQEAYDVFENASKFIKRIQDMMESLNEP